MVALAWDASIVQAVEFDYDAVDEALGFPADAIDPHILLDGLSRMLQWINNASNARAKEIRLQAVRYFLDPKNQVQLAREVGVQKATISQKAVEFRDYFQIKNPAAAASSMRSDKARKTFSEKCTLNHQKKKASSALNGSQTTSGQNSTSRFDLRARVLKVATGQ